MTPYARHGDLVIYAIDELPLGAPPLDTRVLQRGSSDDADHVVTGDARLYAAPTGATYLVTEAGCDITHSARHTIGRLPAGVYAIVRLVQATDDGVRAVED